MKRSCPYCGGPLSGDAVLPKMSGRALRIYKTLVAAGPAGVKTPDLLVRMYAEEEWPTPGGNTVLRVQVHNLNKILASHGQHIVWHSEYGRKDGGYRLISTEQEYNDK